MPVVAVINRKGGSGKSTLATNLAGYCANNDMRVMLGDVDRQQSSLTWLRRRAAQALARNAAIVGWAIDNRSVMRPPAGITHVVLDTPGGLRGLDLARIVMSADAILMPVCDSAFDRESAADCHAELMTLPRLASGRCKIAMIGMRLDARTKAAARLEAWAAKHEFPYIGALRESQTYVRSAELGLTLFDLPAAKVESDLAQWRPIIDWVQAAWQPSEKSEPRAVTATTRPTQPNSAAPDAPLPQRAPRARAELPESDPVALAVFESPRRGVRAGLAQRLGSLFAVFRSSN
jgi:chromosome partitioning protein